MNILVLSSLPKSKEDIKNFSGVVAYYLNRELSKDKDIEYRYLWFRKVLSLSPEQQLREFKKLDLTSVDHIIGLAVRFFSFIDKKSIEYLKSQISGLVTQTYETPRKDFCDITFAFRDNSSKYSKTFVIGAGADPEICYPNQNDKIFTILLDHSKRSKGEDLSEKLVKQAYEFSQNKVFLQKLNQKYNTNFQEIKIRRFLDKGLIETITSENINKKVNNTYKPSGLSYPEFCKEYGYAHVFIVTHPESLGLSVLESAMSGVLILSPKNFINMAYLETLRHIEFIDNIDWDGVFKEIDIQKSRNQVIGYTWDKAFKKLINFLKKEVK